MLTGKFLGIQRNRRQVQNLGLAIPPTSRHYLESLPSGTPGQELCIYQPSYFSYIHSPVKDRSRHLDRSGANTAAASTANSQHFYQLGANKSASVLSTSARIDTRKSRTKRGVYIFIENLLS